MLTYAVAVVINEVDPPGSVEAAEHLGQEK